MEKVSGGAKKYRRKQGGTWINCVLMTPENLLPVQRELHLETLWCEYFVGRETEETTLKYKMGFEDFCINISIQKLHLISCCLTDNRGQLSILKIAWYNFVWKFNQFSIWHYHKLSQTMRSHVNSTIFIPRQFLYRVINCSVHNKTIPLPAYKLLIFNSTWTDCTNATQWIISLTCLCVPSLTFLAVFVRS